MKLEIEKLLTQDDEIKNTQYVELSNSDHDSNRLKIENATSGLNLKDEDRQTIKQSLSNPRLNSSIAIFSKGDQVELIDSIKYPYSGEYSYKRFFLLPYFDYRNYIYQNLYLLNFSRNSITLYEASYNHLEEVNNIEFSTFESELAKRSEQRSIQHHGNQNSSFHGQNASGSKDTESTLVTSYIRGISEELNSFLDAKNAKIVICSTIENINIFRSSIKENNISPISIEGNLEDTSQNDIVELLKNSVSENIETIIKDLADNLDINKSQEIETESFINILSIIEKGKVEDMYIGKLGKFDADYTNPISPLGANYIALEVLKLGGSVHYFPDQDFTFSKNNISYRFRF